MLKTTLVGKEETFRSLGIRGSCKVELESLIVTLRKQFEQEYCATGNTAQGIPALVENGDAVTGDRRSQALAYACNHPVFPLRWSKNRLTREEMNER